VAGVSQTTVSFVLNGRGSISDGVRERVRIAAAELGFRPNSQARATRTGESRTIGLIIPDLRNPFPPELVEAVGNAAQRNGYAISSAMRITWSTSAKAFLILWIGGWTAFVGVPLPKWTCHSRWSFKLRL
jgi:ABC-type sugar transport system substrate-binding protein